MKVRIDSQIFTRQRYGGISRYFVELCREFIRDPQLGVTLSELLNLSSNEDLQELVGPSRFTPPGRVGRRAVAELAGLVDAARTRVGPTWDVTHFTYYEPRARSRSRGAKVITIHDMLPELMPEYFPYGSAHLAKQNYWASCDAALFVSETSRRSCLEIFGDRDIPTAVTPLGVSTEFSPSQPVPQIEAPYLLFVGNRSAYKDFATVLAAFHRSRLNDSVLLVAAGGPPFTARERRTVEELGLHGSVRHVPVRRSDLPGLYAHATCFVFPSRYEGFGLPTLEAMASGCPVVLSRAPALVEVGGSAARYFDTGDPDSLAWQLVDVITGTGKAALKAAGQRRAMEFTWPATARQTAALYERAMAT